MGLSIGFSQESNLLARFKPTDEGLNVAKELAKNI